MGYKTDYQRIATEAAEFKYHKIRYAEEFRKKALPYIEQGKTFFDMMQDHHVFRSDEVLFNEIAEEVRHQKELDAAFLKGLQWDPMREQDACL